MQGNSGESTRVRRGSKDEGMKQPYKPMAQRAYRNNAEFPASLDNMEAALIRGFRLGLESVPVFDKSERRLVEDILQGKGIKMFVRGCEIIRRGSDIAGRVALSDHLRFCLKNGHALDLTEREVFNHEMAANQEGDKAQWGHRWSPSRGTVEWVSEAMMRQAAWSEATADVVLASRPALVQVR